MPSIPSWCPGKNNHLKDRNWRYRTVSFFLCHVCGSPSSCLCVFYWCIAVSLSYWEVILTHFYQWWGHCNSVLQWTPSSGEGWLCICESTLSILKLLVVQICPGPLSQGNPFHVSLHWSPLATTQPDWISGIPERFVQHGQLWVHTFSTTFWCPRSGSMMRYGTGKTWLKLTTMTCSQTCILPGTALRLIILTMLLSIGPTGFPQSLASMPRYGCDPGSSRLWAPATWPNSNTVADGCRVVRQEVFCRAALWMPLLQMLQSSSPLCKTTALGIKIGETVPWHFCDTDRIVGGVWSRSLKYIIIIYYTFITL